MLRRNQARTQQRNIPYAMVGVHHSLVVCISAVGAGGAAGYTAESPSKHLLLKLIRFGQN